MNAPEIAFTKAARVAILGRITSLLDDSSALLTTTAKKGQGILDLISEAIKHPDLRAFTEKYPDYTLMLFMRSQQSPEFLAEADALRERGLLDARDAYDAITPWEGVTGGNEEVVSRILTSPYHEIQAFLSVLNRAKRAETVEAKIESARQIALHCFCSGSESADPLHASGHTASPMRQKFESFGHDWKNWNNTRPNSALHKNQIAALIPQYRKICEGMFGHIAFIHEQLVILDRTPTPPTTGHNA